MDYKLVKMDNYNIYFSQTKNFKTISLSIRFKKKKTIEDFVYSGILRKILKAGSNNYKNINDYYKAKFDLYNPGINIGITNFGPDQIFYVNSKFSNEKYTKAGMHKKTINFILDSIYKPKAENNEFEKELFELSKHECIEKMKALKDDPFRYTVNRLWEEMDVYDFKIPSTNELIKLAKKISSKDLYNYYNDLVKNSTLDIFVMGDFNEEEIKSIIDKNIKGNFGDNHKNKYITFENKISKAKEIIEDKKATQSQMAISLKLTNLTDFERQYVSMCYSNILGGGWSSKLMQIVREKHSLCYHIGTNRDISHSLIFVYAFIDAKDYKKCLKLVKEIIESMKKGDFTDAHLDQVKELYLNAIKEAEDHQSLYISNLIDMIFTGTDDFKTRKKKIAEVTKEDIMKVASKVQMDVVYFLKGEM